MAEEIINIEDIDERKQDVGVMERACQMLMQHFDTVQVFVTRKDKHSDGTVRGDRGKGNWYARYGQIKEWVIMEENAFIQREEE